MHKYKIIHRKYISISEILSVPLSLIPKLPRQPSQTVFAAPIPLCANETTNFPVLSPVPQNSSLSSSRAASRLLRLIDAAAATCSSADTGTSSSSLTTGAF